ncbi:MAG TPA: GNAT family N-acetyltransferase [Syntrophales bacterium]|nr:GNAT family N-acetyltransferase [Syntrophales bacterium]
MDIVQIIDPMQDPRWDTFVENHPFGWIVHLSGWKKVLESSFRHIKGHYLVLIDTASNNIQAALPIFEVRSRLLGNRLVSIPFATLCDPLISTSGDMTRLFEEAVRLSKQRNIPSIEIRTLMSISLIQEDSMGVNLFYKHHYLLLDKDPEELKRTFNRTNVRKGINKAIRSNLVMKVADSESDLRIFYELHIKNRKKLGLPPQPYRFFQMLWDTFMQSGKMILILAQKDDQTIAGLISFKYKDRFSCEYLATDQRFLGIRPNNFLFWEAIKTAYNEGFKVFDFGRTALNNEGLMNFKNRWGTTMVDFPYLYYPAKLSKKMNNQKTVSGYKLINKICENSPDLVCKLLGQICYKHLG